MNKQYSFKIVIVLLIGICLINLSCKKYIDQAPITSTYGAEFWKSQTSVEQATSAMYGQLRSSLRQDASFFINGDLASGAFKSSAWNYASISADGSKPFNFSYVPYLESSLQNWSRFYQLIAQTNLILENVPKMSTALFDDEATKNRYLGEALFMKAYTYFYITRIWGDPVFVSQTYDDVDYGKIPPLARTPEAKVLDSCISYLKTAAGYMSYTGGDPAKASRANKGAVYALLAHIYAWKHDYANAHIACNEVITNGGYSLEPMATYKNIWTAQGSPENILELSMQYNDNDPNFNNQNYSTKAYNWSEAVFNFFGTFLKGPIVNNERSSCWISPDGGMAGYMDSTEDARYKLIFKHVPASGGDGSGYMLTKYVDFHYKTPPSTLPYINNNLVLFRLSDIVLLDAEARASTGDLPGALNNLALTEDRAGITDYQNVSSQYDIMDEIVIERFRELVGEGQWYYDVIRTDQTQGWLYWLGYTQDGRLEPANKGYYWPLDMATLFPQDILLTQNPWWAVHK